MLEDIVAAKQAAFCNWKTQITRPMAESIPIHSDVHLGNWYVAGAELMGLCDWQCISRGHWARDLSYAMSTALTVARGRKT